MRFLLDTHLLLWAAGSPNLLPVRAVELMQDRNHTLSFSAVSVWETAIKHGRGKKEFQVEPGLFRRTLLENGLEELAVLGEHAVAAAGLPSIHKDPFDRILIAQAMVEGITLLTADAIVAKYPGPIQLV